MSWCDCGLLIPVHYPELVAEIEDLPSRWAPTPSRLLAVCLPQPGDTLLPRTGDDLRPMDSPSGGVPARSVPAGVFIRLQGSEVSMGASDSQVKNGDTVLPYQRFRVYLGPGNEGWLT